VGPHTHTHNHAHPSLQACNRCSSALWPQNKRIIGRFTPKSQINIKGDTSTL